MKAVLYLVLITICLMSVSSCEIFNTQPDQVADPVFEPIEGYYNVPQVITITSATPGAVIRYSLNAGAVDTEGILYTEPVRVDPGTLIKARATKSGMKDSRVVHSAYFGQAQLIQSVVSAGSFNNGVSTVNLDSYSVSRHEITQGQYQQVMGSLPVLGYGAGEFFPVYNVSWFDAIEYCNRRSILEGLNPVYEYSTFGTNPDSWPAGWNATAANQANVICQWRANGYRLPSEMEWEYAARGGNQSSGYAYSGSNNVSLVAWYGANSAKRSRLVGVKLANELGLKDMSGNVWEWVWDFYADYPTEAQVNPTGPMNGSQRVLRGGGWESGGFGLGVGDRSMLSPTVKRKDLGFRVVRSL